VWREKVKELRQVYKSREREERGEGKGGRE
jgi:hypothetical protein